MKTLRLMKTRSTCRICDGKDLVRVFSFGPTALANAFVSKDKLHEPETFFPLDVYLCRTCSLVQMLDIVSPEVLFTDYLYASSTSPVFRAHFDTFADSMCKRFSLSKHSLIVDIGSNDGILLEPFKKRGARVLGIDPAETVAKDARKKGIPTEVVFFSSLQAKRLAKKYGTADLITATNVFAHIDDIRDIVKGVKTFLKPEGVFIIEAPYLVEFLKQNLFDTVYHEHLSYYSVTALEALFQREGMRIIDVEMTETHGGSLRVFVQKGLSGHRESSVGKFLATEKKLELHKDMPYRAFAQRIMKNKAMLQGMLLKLKLQGKKIAGYGAPAKATTLLSYFGIGADVLDYIVDDSPYKQGRYTPGNHIPVVSSETLKKNPPDYLLIIAWNFKDPIMKKNEDFRKSGGQFIIPVPKPQVIK